MAVVSSRRSEMELVLVLNWLNKDAKFIMGLVWLFGIGYYDVKIKC